MPRPLNKKSVELAPTWRGWSCVSDIYILYITSQRAHTCIWCFLGCWICHGLPTRFLQRWSVGTIPPWYVWPRGYVIFHKLRRKKNHCPACSKHQNHFHSSSGDFVNAYEALYMHWLAGQVTNVVLSCCNQQKFEKHKRSWSWYCDTVTGVCDINSIGFRPKIKQAVSVVQMFFSFWWHKLIHQHGPVHATCFRTDAKIAPTAMPTWCRPTSFE